MSLDENKALVRRFIERVYNSGDIGFVDAIVDLGFVRHGIGGTMRGPRSSRTVSRPFDQHFLTFRSPSRTR